VSQSPSPYQPPQPYPYGASHTLPAPANYARNAGVLMIVLGVMVAVFAGVIIAAGFGLTDMNNLPPEQREDFLRAEAEMEAKWGIESLTLFKITGGIFAVPAFAMVFLGLYIRRGNTVAIILGIIAGGLGVLGLGMMTLLSLPAGNLLVPCVLSFPLAVFGLTTYWLTRAIMTTGPLKVFNEQHQAHQWQMAQQARAQQEYYQQMYQQQGFNYASPPPPPPPQTPAKDADQPPT
jgi:hypothetical protein